MWDEPAVRWILFDQAGVQIKMFPTREKYLIDDKEYLGLELAKIYDHPLYDRYRLGEISEKEFVGTFLDESGIDLSIDSFIDFFANEIELIPGMLELIFELKKKYLLASIVNEGKEWSLSKFEKTEMGKLFDHIYISGIIGLRKPNKDIFEYVLEKIDAKPEECIFIDDLEVNCKGAEKLGIQSICFKNTKQLRKELTELGVL